MWSTMVCNLNLAVPSSPRASRLASQCGVRGWKDLLFTKNFVLAGGALLACWAGIDPLFTARIASLLKLCGLLILAGFGAIALNWLRYCAMMLWSLYLFWTHPVEEDWSWKKGEERVKHITDIANVLQKGTDEIPEIPAELVRRILEFDPEFGLQEECEDSDTCPMDCATNLEGLKAITQPSSRQTSASDDIAVSGLFDAQFTFGEGTK